MTFFNNVLLLLWWIISFFQRFIKASMPAGTQAGLTKIVKSLKLKNAKWCIVLYLVKTSNILSDIVVKMDPSLRTKHHCTLAHHYEKTIKGVENNHIYIKKENLLCMHISIVHKEETLLYNMKDISFFQQTILFCIS